MLRKESVQDVEGVDQLCTILGWNFLDALVEHRTLQNEQTQFRSLLLKYRRSYDDMSAALKHNRRIVIQPLIDESPQFRF